MRRAFANKRENRLARRWTTRCPIERCISTVKETVKESRTFSLRNLLLLDLQQCYLNLLGDYRLSLEYPELENYF